MKYAAVHYRRFGPPADGWIYVTPSAAVYQLEPLAVRIVDTFSQPDGEDYLQWSASINSDPETLALFRDLLNLGVIRPLGELVPPIPDLPPMPFPLATLVLNVTNKCNLSCTYCYEYGEDKVANPADDRPALMSVETARQSIDFFFANSEGRDEVGITFFGGETLLNLAAIRAAATYARECAASRRIRVHFALTTNATLLTTEVIEFLVDHNFGINVSIDGPKEVQDTQRAFASGGGSYDRIAPAIRKLNERIRQTPGSRPAGARVTLTRQAVPWIHETFRHLTRDLGFYEVGFAPVTSAPGRTYALAGEDYELILAAFHHLAAEFVEFAVRGEHHGFSNLNDLLREIHQGANKAHPCGAGLGLVGVATDGEIGLCHRFVESDAFSLGHITSGLDAERREDFLRRGHISRKVACHECWARPMCSGGCYHEAYVRYADASQPNLHYCDWIRAWTDIGLETYARIMAVRPEFFERFDSTFVMET